MRRMRVGPGRDLGRDPRRAQAARPGAGGDRDHRARDGGRHALGRLPLAVLALVRERRGVDRELRPADPGGRAARLHAARRGTTRPPSTREERAFCGAIGGLGYLGAVVSITYRVISAGRGTTRSGCGRSCASSTPSATSPRTSSRPRSGRTSRTPTPRPGEARRDLVGSRHPRRRHQVRALLHLAFAATRTRRRMALHRPKLLCGSLVEWLMRVPFISKLMWRFYVRFLFRTATSTSTTSRASVLHGRQRAGEADRQRARVQDAERPADLRRPQRSGAEGGWDRAKRRSRRVARVRARVPPGARPHPDAERRAVRAEGPAVPAVRERQPAGLRGQLRVRDLEPGAARSAPRRPSASSPTCSGRNSRAASTW